MLHLPIFRICIGLLLWMPTLCVSGQGMYASDPELQNDVQAYLVGNIRMDFDTVLAYMPPKLFEAAPKEAVKESLRQSFDNDALTLRFDTFFVTHYDTIRQSGPYRFTTVLYGGRATLTVKVDDVNFGAMIFGFMEQQYGSGSVIPDVNQPKVYTIHLSNRKMIAFRRPEYDTWKFLEDKRESQVPEERQAFLEIIPPEVLSGLH